MSYQSELEELFLFQAKHYGLPQPSREWKFHPIRKWAFDFAWVGYKIAVEVEGGLYPNSRGRHARIEGFTEDCVKYNEAIRFEWRVYRFSGPQIEDASAVIYMKLILEYERTKDQKYRVMLDQFYRSKKQINWPVELL